jgi:hypothetical protein
VSVNQVLCLKVQNMLMLAGCSLGLLWQLLRPRLPQGMPHLTPVLKRHLWQLLRDDSSQLSFSTEELMQAARCASCSSSSGGGAAAGLLLCYAQHNMRSPTVSQRRQCGAAHTTVGAAL